MGILLKKMSAKYAGLAWKFHVSQVSCDNPAHFEQYIQLNAISEHAAGRGLTHILVDTKTEDLSIDLQKARIIGFITLRATSIVESNYHTLQVNPAIEIAELAVDQEYEHKGFGSKLIDTTIYLATQLNENFIGIQNIVVCAASQAVAFYENPRIGFGRLEDYYVIPRDGWNDTCIPMYIKLYTG